MTARKVLRVDDVGYAPNEDGSLTVIANYLDPVTVHSISGLKRFYRAVGRVARRSISDNTGSDLQSPEEE